MQEVVLKQVEYKNYKECVKLDNGIVDVVITVSVGPRIIRYGFIGQCNELCDDAPMTLPVLDDEWRLMGGHRLLHSPEEFPRTYEPDNDAVRCEEIQNGLRVIYEQKKIANIKKVMEITLFPGEARVQVLHKLINENAWAIRTAPWACTVMAMGGTVIIPFAPEAGHFKNGATNARYATIWSYTELSDKRLRWGKKFVTIEGDAKSKKNLKVGFSNRAGWCGYIRGEHLFTVKAAYIHNAEYPDNGCSCEVFTCDFMSEIETLGPYTMLNPKEETTHIEQWNLIENVCLASLNDGEVDEMVEKYI